MNKSNLMPYDWVQTLDGRYIQVDKEDMDATIKPAQITTDIVLLNDFILDMDAIHSKRDVVYKHKTLDIVIRFDYDCNEGKIGFVDSLDIVTETATIYLTRYGYADEQIYVNELQQALRLAGLKDFANNWKIYSEK